MSTALLVVMCIFLPAILYCFAQVITAGELHAVLRRGARKVVPARRLVVMDGPFCQCGHGYCFHAHRDIARFSPDARCHFKDCRCQTYYGAPPVDWKEIMP